MRAMLKSLNSVKFVVAFLVGLLTMWAIFQDATLPCSNPKEKMMTTDTHSSAKTVQKLPRGENSLHRRIEVEASKIMKKDGLSVGIWINHGNLQDDDPLLVEYVRKVHLIPPSNANTPYVLRTTNISYGLAQHVMEFVEDVRDGFFVESGANDGEFLTNTLKLERDLHWTGLLIEADNKTFSMLRSTNRKAWLSGVCLSNETRPKTTTFFRSIFGDSGIGGLRKRAEAGVIEEIQVPCFPFYTMLLAMNRTVVDFLSLDIEGVELEVLKTIPFDKVLFKTMAIEHWTIPEGAAGLKAFMESKGYKFIMETTGNDSIFVHRSIYCKKYKC